MKKSHKILMIGGIVIASLILVIIGAGFYLESRADTIIKREFSRLTDGRYQFNAGWISVSLWRRSVTFSDIEIRPDPAHIPPADTAALSKMLFNISAKKLYVSGIHFKKHDGKIDMEIRKLELSSPNIKVLELPHSAPSPKDTSAVAKAMKVDIHRIILSDGSVEHTKIVKNDTIRNIITRVKLEVDNFFIDNDNPGNGNHLLGNNMRLSITKITRIPKDESTRLEVDSIYMETGKKLLKFSRFALVPTYSKNDFAIKSWRHADWTAMAVHDVACSGVDYDHFLNKGALKIDSISIASGEISSYKNRNVKRDEWVKTLFQQKIQRLPVKIDIGKVQIGNFGARYEELALGGSEPGSISFSNLSGKISNLTNIMPAKTPYIEIEAAGILNNSGHLNATILLPVDSLTNRFEVVATLGQTNLPDMNTMITPLTNILIDKGVVDKMTVHIVGTTTHASSDMTFLYHDLQVTLLKEKNNVVTQRKFLSTVVNQLIIKNSNPWNGRVRNVHTETDRDPYRSPFNFMWRTLFDGMKETVGI